jgi:hypothetical protein
LQFALLTLLFSLSLKLTILSWAYKLTVSNRETNKQTKTVSNKETNEQANKEEKSPSQILLAIL